MSTHNELFTIPNNFSILRNKSRNRDARRSFKCSSSFQPLAIDMLERTYARKIWRFVTQFTTVNDSINLLGFRWNVSFPRVKGGEEERKVEDSPRIPAVHVARTPTDDSRVLYISVGNVRGIFYTRWLMFNSAEHRGSVARIRTERGSANAGRLSVDWPGRGSKRRGKKRTAGTG